MPAGGSKRWCFTVNNADADPWRPSYSEEHMSFLVWEFERAPTTGMGHIQGYVRFKTVKRMSAAKRFLKGEAHLEVARGSEEENYKYCTKERHLTSDFAEHGQYDSTLRQGRRSDLEDVSNDIIAGALHFIFTFLRCLMRFQGKQIRDVALAHPVEFMKFHSGILELSRQLAAQPPVRREVQTMVLWGSTGVGKTHRIMMKYPEAYIVRPGRDPFSGYGGQKEIVFEEFISDDWKIQDMNCWLDVWRTKLDCRYHDKYPAWEKVFILSNMEPTGWFFATPDEVRKAFFRRIPLIVEVQDREQNISLI